MKLSSSRSGKLNEKAFALVLGIACFVGVELLFVRRGECCALGDLIGVCGLKDVGVCELRFSTRNLDCFDCGLGLCSGAGLGRVDLFFKDSRECLGNCCSIRIHHQGSAPDLSSIGGI